MSWKKVKVRVILSFQFCVGQELFWHITVTASFSLFFKSSSELWAWILRFKSASFSLFFKSCTSSFVCLCKRKPLQNFRCGIYWFRSQIRAIWVTNEPRLGLIESNRDSQGKWTNYVTLVLSSKAMSSAKNMHQDTSPLYRMSYLI